MRRLDFQTFGIAHERWSPLAAGRGGETFRGGGVCGEKGWDDVRGVIGEALSRMGGDWED